MRINHLGNVGIGTTSPTALLHLAGTAGKVSLEINSNETTSSNNILMLRSDVASADDPVFRVQANGATYADGAYSSSGADYAEYFRANDTDLVAGELVCIDPANEETIQRCQRERDTNVIGIISSNPSFVGNNIPGAEADLGEINQNYKLVGLIGQVETRVSNENGTIRVGDSLTSASRPGYAMKANPGDSTVGIALQSLPENKETGTIKVLISRRNKSLTVETVEEEISQRIAEMEIEDEVRALMNGTDIKVADLESRLSALEFFSVGIDENKLSINRLEEQMDLLRKENEAISDLIATLNLASVVTKDAFGNVNLLGGQLEAEGIVAGVFSVKTVDPDKKTIGTATIEAIKKDENQDGICDETGSDGKSVMVYTKAVTESAKVFIGFENNPGGYGWVEKVLDPATGEFVGFRIFVSQPVIEDKRVNWWIVEEEKTAVSSGGEP